MSNDPVDIPAMLSKALDVSPTGAFCGAALVARDDGVVFATARGLSDRDRSIPNRVDTRFAIGSLTKQFTAAAVLRLEDEGLLSVDDPIHVYLGVFPGPKNAATIHHLLIHTAGLIRAGTSWVTTNRAAFVQAMKETPIESAPGERCRYSNAGFGLLGAIIETVTGTSYEEVLASRFFQPLGMTSSGCFEPSAWSNTPGTARGYRRRHLTDGTLSPIEAVIPGTSEWALDWSIRASAGVTSTIHDLHRWEVALASEAVLSPNATRRMFAPHVRMPERSGSYAYGWCVEQSCRGEHTVFHSGRYEGFQAACVRYPARGFVVILLTNVIVDEGDAGWYTNIQDNMEAAMCTDDPARDD
jgi:CubicO group peptidase (beta-lactamase class C family)